MSMKDYSAKFHQAGASREVRTRLRSELVVQMMDILYLQKIKTNQ